MGENPVADTVVTALMLSAFVLVSLTVAAAAWLLFIVVLHLAVGASGTLLGVSCT